MTPLHIPRALRRALLAAGAGLALAAAGCGDGAESLTQASGDHVLTVQKITTAPNPSGLRFGFYEVENKQSASLGLAGRRSIARAGYEHWASSEHTQGQYTFTTTQTCAASHAYGEEVITSVALSFTQAVSGLHSTIPSFYPQDITDPTTRAAAKKYLYAYVQNLLKAVGRVQLAIDNEMVSNWRLDNPDDPDAATRAATWGAWYLEAAATARQAAADLGMSGSLRLVPVVNGDPFVQGNPIAAGPGANAWLVNAVAVSDGLAIDSYHSDPAQPVTDPQITIDTISFWIDNYAAGKPVTMTENGFTTITSWSPGITREERGGKLTGTEAEQSEYFAALLPALQAANAPGGAFHDQLRAFSIWSNIDNQKAPDIEDMFFGLLRADETPKPAAAAVTEALAAIEASAYDAPWTAVGDPVDVTASVGSGVTLTTTDGDTFEFLRYHDSALAHGTACHLRGTVAQQGALMIRINGHWVHAGVDAGAFDVNLPANDCLSSADNLVDIQATGAIYPFTQTITGLTLATQ